MLAAPEVALQGPPLLGFGDGVLDADPPGGLGLAVLLPADGVFGRAVLTWFLRRRADLRGEVAGQALVAGIDVGSDTGMMASAPCTTGTRLTANFRCGSGPGMTSASGPRSSGWKGEYRSIASSEPGAA